MESCAVYLCDWGQYIRIWKLYREYKQGERKDENSLMSALSCFQDANAKMEILVMKYTRICDLISMSPDGHLEWNGPFCGEFCTSDVQYLLL